MSGKRITLILAAAALATVALSGCVNRGPVVSPHASTTPSATSSQVTTEQASVEPTRVVPVETAGPITSPKTGSEERKALLDAARLKLQTKSPYIVYQLYVQGDTALGDIEAETKDKNGRIVVAWERTNGKWAAIGATKYGSPAATAANTARALPSFTTELINKIDWALAKPKPVSGASASSASMIKSLSSAAQTWSDTAMNGKGTPYKVTVAKVAKDSKGVWWGHAVVQPTGDASNSYEALNFWAKYSAGDWQGALQDPEPPAPSTYFPASVISKLGL
jgi:predicted small lipoprotein YifL